MSIEIPDDMLKSLKLEYEARKSDPIRSNRSSRGSTLNNKEISSSLNGRVRLQPTKTSLPRQEDSQIDISITSICESDIEEIHDNRQTYLTQANGDISSPFIFATTLTRGEEVERKTERRLVPDNSPIGLVNEIQRHNIADSDIVKKLRLSTYQDGNQVKINRNSNVPQV
jgi:hypothetical protein